MHFLEAPAAAQLQLQQQQQQQQVRLRAFWMITASVESVWPVMLLYAKSKLIKMRQDWLQTG
jgi:uncharacterized membrane protein